MAWPMSGTMAAAVAAADRKPDIQFLAWLDGDAGSPTDLSYMVSAWSMNRTPSDSPEQVSRFAGSIAAGLNVTLQKVGPAFPGENVLLSGSLGPLSPIMRSGWADQDWGAGIRVQLRIGFKTPVLETVPAFVGRVDDIAVNPDGSISWTCVDDLLSLQTIVDLPVLAVTPGDPPIPAYVVVEHLLRGGGMLTTPPLPTGGRTILSVPSLIPEVGQPARPIRYAGDVGRQAFRAAPVADCTYTSTEVYTPAPLSSTVIAGWWKSTNTNALNGLIQIGEGSGLWIKALANGAIQASLNDGTLPLTTAAGLFPTDGAFHFWTFRVVYGTTATPGQTTLTVTRDGAVVGTVTQAYSLAVQDNYSGKTIIGGYVHEAVSITVASPGQTITLGPDGSTWTPNYTADIRGATATLTAIPRGQSGKIIDLISSIATGIGAIYRFKEDGSWRWEERQSIADRRFAASVGDYDGTTLISSGYSYNNKSRRRAVTIDWSEFAAVQSTLTAPAWSTTELITVPPGMTVMDFETENPILSILTVRTSQTLSALYSSCVVVPAYQVGDPAAEVLTNRLIIRTAPTAGGFRVRFTNLDGRPLALWNPATQAPQFVLQGFTLAGGNPRTYTAQASPRSREDLMLDSSLWRQDRASSVAMCDAIAASVTQPAIIFNDQVTVSNPSHTVDDIVRISVPNMTSGLIPAQVIGMNYELTEQSLTVRQCYPPIGWVLGVPARSTIPTITIPA